MLFGGWELASRNGVVSAAPAARAQQGIRHAGRSLGVLLEQAQPTFWGAVAGILFAAVLGIALGGAVSDPRTLMQTVYPTIVFFQLIPKVALAPVFLLWFGTGFGANVIFSVFIAFFPVVVATIAGLQAAPPSYERLCRSLMMSRLKMFLTVKFPFALPHIFSRPAHRRDLRGDRRRAGRIHHRPDGPWLHHPVPANNFETALLLAAILLLCGVGIVLFAFFLALETIVMRFYYSR